MTVFLPDVMVALVMVFVLDTPMVAHRAAKPGALIRRQTRQEASGVCMHVFWGGLLHPFALDFDGTVGG